MLRVGEGSNDPVGLAAGADGSWEEAAPSSTGAPWKPREQCHSQEDCRMVGAERAGFEDLQ